MSKYKTKDKFNKKTTNLDKNVNNLGPDEESSNNIPIKVRSNKKQQEKESITYNKHIDLCSDNDIDKDFSSSEDESDNHYRNFKFNNMSESELFNTSKNSKETMTKESKTFSRTQLSSIKNVYSLPKVSHKYDSDEDDTSTLQSQNNSLINVKDAIKYIGTKKISAQSNKDEKLLKHHPEFLATRHLFIRPLNRDDLNECIEEENILIANLNTGFTFDIDDKLIKKVENVEYYNYGFDTKRHTFMTFIPYFDAIDRDEHPDSNEYRHRYLNDYLKNEPIVENDCRLIVSYEYSNDSKRRYLVFSDPVQYLRIIQKIPVEYICFHELIFGNRWQKIKFDIEAYLKDFPFLTLEYWENAIKSFIGEVIIPVFARVYNIQLTYEKDFIVDTSTNENKKFSSHIVIDNYKVSSNIQAAEFSLQVFDECDRDDVFFKFIDKDVNKNRQNFRLRYSVKREDLERRKIPYFQFEDKTFLNSLIYYTSYCSALPNIIDIDKINKAKNNNITCNDPELQKCLEILLNKFDIEFSIRNSDLGKNKIHLDYDTDNAIPCTICNVSHQGDHPYLNKDKKGNIYYVCHRASTYGKRYPNDRIPLINKNNDVLPDSERLIKHIPDIAKQANSSHVPDGNLHAVKKQNVTNNFRKPWRPLDVKLVFQQFGDNYIFHDEHYETPEGDIRGKLRDYFYCKTLCIRAGMGCGKTKQLIQYIKTVLKENPNFRILVLSMRITLAYDQYEKLKQLGFYLYLDETGKIKREKIICSAESSGKLEAKPFDLVILDESESFFEQLSSKTMNNGDVQRSLAIIYNNLRRARQVIALDAFLGERTINLLLRYRHTDEDTNKVDISDFHVQHNTFKLNSNEVFYCYSDSVVWDKNLLTALNSGKKIVVCSFKSAVKTNNEASRIEKMFPQLKVACYTRETKPSKKREHFSDFNEHVKDVDVLIYTSTLDVGVSVEIERFDQCFVFIEPACPTTVEHVLQMCRRVRNLTDHEYHVYMKPKWSNIPESIRDIEQMIQIDYNLSIIASGSKNNIFGLPHKIDRNGHFVYDKVDYYYTHIENLRHRFISKNHFKDLFIYYVKEVLGAEFVPYESATEILRDYKRKAEKDKTFTVPEDELNYLLEEVLIEKDMRKYLKQMRKVEYLEYCEEIASSKPIDDKKAKKLERKIRNNQDIEEEELLSLKKHTLAKIYDEPIEGITNGDYVKKLSDPKYMKHYKNVLEIKDHDIDTIFKEMATNKINRFEIHRHRNIDNEVNYTRLIDTSDLAKELKTNREQGRTFEYRTNEDGYLEIHEVIDFIGDVAKAYNNGLLDKKKKKKVHTETESEKEAIRELKDKYKYDYKAFIDFNCKDNFIKHFICWLLIQVCGYDDIFDKRTLKKQELEDNLNANCGELEDWLKFISFVFERTRFRNNITEWKFEDKLKYINGIINSMYGCGIKATEEKKIKGKTTKTNFQIKHTIEFIKNSNTRIK